VLRLSGVGSRNCLSYKPWSDLLSSNTAQRFLIVALLIASAVFLDKLCYRISFARVLAPADMARPSAFRSRLRSLVARYLGQRRSRSAYA
jgi:hypothetical protein